jgi:hypothetical protein
MRHSYTEMCIVFSIVKGKKWAYETTIWPMCLSIFELQKQVHDFHSILMLTLCAGGHPTSLFLIFDN